MYVYACKYERVLSNTEQIILSSETLSYKNSLLRIPLYPVKREIVKCSQGVGLSLTQDQW